MELEVLCFIKEFDSMGPTYFKKLTKKAMGQTFCMMCYLDPTRQNKSIFEAFMNMTKRFFEWSKTNECNEWNRSHIETYEKEFIKNVDEFYLDFTKKIKE